MSFTLDRERIAATEDHVFLVGDLAHRAAVIAFSVHQASARSDEPFEVVRCSGISDAQILQLLTGVVDEAGNFLEKGILSRAAGGSVCIIGVDEMGPRSQALLENVITSGQFYPTGGQLPELCDVRLIVTAETNLKSLTQAGKFRPNLFYLVTEQVLVFPKINEQIDDIQGVMLQQLIELGARNKYLDEEAISLIVAKGYLEDRRELRNLLKRAIARNQDEKISFSIIEAVMSEADLIGIAPSNLAKNVMSSHESTNDDIQRRPSVLDMPISEEINLKSGEAPPDLVEYDRRYWQYLMDYVAGDKKRAADIAGVSLRTLYRRLEAAGVEG
jgi:DNA-binding NtrC family response regulator